MPLDTLANVKTRLGITGSSDDVLLGLLQDTADAWIAGYCDRDFLGGTFTEYHPGGTFVFLRNFPVASVTSVKADTGYGFGASTVVPTAAYVVHADRGVIQSLAGPFVAASSPRSVQVVYTTATGAVPADVKEAHAILVGHWYRHAKTQAAAEFRNVTQQTVAGVTTIFGTHQIAGLALPDDLLRLLAPYRTPAP